VNKAKAHDSLIGSIRALNKKRGQEAKRPNPIRTSSRTPSVDLAGSHAPVSETDYGEPSALTQEAMMAVDIGGPVVEGNSPTPKADIPLVPATPANPQISDMMNFMKDCMDQQSKCLGEQLEPLIHCIERLEASKPDYNNMVPDYTADEYNTWTNPHDNLEYQSVEPTYPAPPPRIDEDEIMNDMDKAHAANVTAFNASADEEDEYHTLYNMGLAPTDEQIQKEAEAEFWTTEKIQEAELAQLGCRTLYLQSRRSIADPQPTTPNQPAART
jgi:hypothetical protein